MSRRALRVALALCAPLALFACRASAPSADDPPATPESPQAKAVPAPLATLGAAPSAQAMLPVGLDAGPPPLPMRADQPVPADYAVKDSAGYTFQAVLRAGDPPASSRGAEVSSAGIDAAKRKLEPRLSIDVASSRARFVFDSPAFVLPVGSELRARADRYGHLLFVPGSQLYRVAAPGSLRALFGERRLDVAPLASAEVVPRGDGARRLGMRTRRVEISTRAATANIEIASIKDLGDGGVLVGRALLDLINAHPGVALCGLDELPVRAEIRWTTQGSLTFEVVASGRRTDLSATVLATPPGSAALAQTPLLAVGQMLLTPQELAAFRTGPIDVPVAPGSDPDVPLLLRNATYELRYAWVDGVPVAWVGPGASIGVPGLLRGRYTFQWRTFLGSASDAPRAIVVPAQLTLGGTDGGSL